VRCVLKQVERELRRVQQAQINDLKKQKMLLVGRIGGLKREMRENTNKNNAVMVRVLLCVRWS
jgi:hypothetical protein